MARHNANLRFPAHTGKRISSKVIDMVVPDDDGIMAGFPAFAFGAFLRGNCAGFGGLNLYNAAEFTVTTTGLGAAAAANTTDAGGVLLTCGSDSTFNTNLQSTKTVTPTSDYTYAAAFRVAVSDITAVGFSLGWGNSQVNPHTTDYTDGVVFKKAANAATVTGRVRGNSGTAAATGTLLTMVNATEVLMGFKCTVSSTTANNEGFFWVVDSDGSFTRTSFTADQLTQLKAILTTPPAMYLNFSAKGSAGNPTVTTSGMMFWDNGLWT